MKFTTFLHRNVSMHFAFYNHGLALHLTVHIRILPNCQNTVDRGNLALQISIKDELIFKLERAFNFDVPSRGYSYWVVYLPYWGVGCVNGFAAGGVVDSPQNPASSAGAVCPWRMGG